MKLAHLSLAVSLALATALLGCDDGGGVSHTPGRGGTGGSIGSSGGASGGNGTAAGGSGASTSAGATGSGAASGDLGIAEKHSDYFTVGSAVTSFHLDQQSAILERDFNRLTAENAMKIADIHPQEATWNHTEADRIADFARERGWKMTGHALLWHRQAPAWMWSGVVKGDATSLETLKARLKAHIEAMIERYGDVVDNWDVVNEAISDTSGKTYRDGGEGSTWYELFGSEEYIYWAFKYAHDALEAQQAGSAAGKLYYNDYTVTTKVDKIMTMLAWLEGEGVRVDGVGFQSHEGMNWPSTTDLQAAIDTFVSAGYKVKISELDVTVYSDYASGSFMPEHEKAFTAELEAAQAARFKSLFELYRANKDHVTSVTFWGISDDRTWLDNEPVTGRNDYPLLYDDAHQPKAARAAILDF